MAGEDEQVAGSAGIYTRQVNTDFGSDSTPSIVLHDVTFAWPGGPPVLSIERLHIDRGERVLLRGPSGSGKSTLLGLIGGVLEPQRGTVRVLGAQLDLLTAGERDRFRGEHVGFIFQMFNLVPYLDVIQNVLLPLRFAPARRRRIGARTREEAMRLLHALGLSDPDLLGRSATRLSVGQQQRVAAARALIGWPEIIIADEPTSALDADARSDFLHLLLRECKAAGTTTLFVSHDPALDGFFDRVLTMSMLGGVRGTSWSL
jgi:putative ABC transport system ATP-binding protein